SMRGEQRPLKPIYPSATPVEFSQNSQASLVTFNELNANPYAFHNQRIRITGDYTPLPEPDCPNFKGPKITWALISDTLQMNSRGFESVIKLVPPGTSLTVEGIWRLFRGTSGCGKDAGQALIWYLQVEQIIEPNPLPNFGPLPTDGTPHSLVNPLTTPTAEDNLITPTEGDMTAVASPTIMTNIPTPTNTAVPQLLPTATPLPATPTPFDFLPTPTSDRVTATPDNSGQPSPTATATGLAPTTSPLPPGTPGTAVPTPPPLVTSTPGPSPRESICCLLLFRTLRHRNRSMRRLTGSFFPAAIY
ncbi:MAG: hypothetical protein P8183_15190, partial [Anaerolineae bacterium]